jgi:hypothetical protein
MAPEERELEILRSVARQEAMQCLLVERVTTDTVVSYRLLTAVNELAGVAAFAGCTNRMAARLFVAAVEIQDALETLLGRLVDTADLLLDTEGLIRDLSSEGLIRDLS